MSHYKDVVAAASSRCLARLLLVCAVILFTDMPVAQAYNPDAGIWIGTEELATLSMQSDPWRQLKIQRKPASFKIRDVQPRPVVELHYSSSKELPEAGHTGEGFEPFRLPDRISARAERSGAKPNQCHVIHDYIEQLGKFVQPATLKQSTYLRYARVVTQAEIRPL